MGAAIPNEQLTSWPWLFAVYIGDEILAQLYFGDFDSAIFGHDVGSLWEPTRIQWNVIRILDVAQVVAISLSSASHDYCRSQRFIGPAFQHNALPLGDWYWNIATSFCFGNIVGTHEMIHMCYHMFCRVLSLDFLLDHTNVKIHWTYCSLSISKSSCCSLQ